jgi:hypothetical protein
MRKHIATVALSLVFLASARTVQAVPILGGQLFYTGGTVTVESLPVTSGLTSELGLYDATFNRLLFIMNDEPSGTVVTFDPSALGVAVGAELIFGIRILPAGGSEFFMGPASRNPDNIMHAIVDDLGTGTLIVGFEDLFNGGDLDFDDNRFSFTGGVVAPEPATLALLGLGAVALARRRRARK